MLVFSSGKLGVFNVIGAGTVFATIAASNVTIEYCREKYNG